MAVPGGLPTREFPVSVEALNAGHHLAGQTRIVVDRRISGRSVLGDTAAFHAEPPPVRPGSRRPEIRAPVLMRTTHDRRRDAVGPLPPRFAPRPPLRSHPRIHNPPPL